MRADQLLVAQGLAPTRSVAQRLIANGAAEWASPTGWAALRKAGEDLPDTAQLRVTDDAELRYVSRGGLKLEGALKRSGFDVAGHTVLDVGQSTGGFTDCLLAHGARHVVGVDVGHGQLHPRLQADARVTALEGMHVRELDLLRPHAPTGGFTLVVGDLSFISMVGSLPELLPWLEVHGHLLVLIKPQFELGPQALGKGGLVKDEADYPRLEARVRLACTALGLKVLDYFDSPITGGDGNREFFLHASR
ncbi:TlyA family RNA methyltransferase [Pelomonas aquatica]|jgi:23S rRNA (cytidine1920-2'-O)/16S rRNA (cytidine1409-2'-O)-methyltransferase|uniref:TlyA family RNA methyltransferase n=1 Tax=Pelomonas aquatica TaxID=431058 RepID=A0A9X4LLQ8_9BURK|nr:TlyA family RNA methyltransferase [Pelomonas aquatica]MCY4755229.1 TlyA family RNA methyltransferase [Pelomonas aquatica]MDG0862538.1 TlyA family RNA methyltransferase [Pelomonas aquatica]